MSYYNKYIKYKAKYLALKNQTGGKSRKDRPSPSESATKFEVGERKKGNDGNLWEIVVNKNGVKRWKKVAMAATNSKTKNDNNKVVVKEKRKMTWNDYSAMSNEDKNFFGIIDFSEESFPLDDMQDTLVIILEINGKEGKLIHSFPGDNPAGIFYWNSKPIIYIRDGDPGVDKGNKIEKIFEKWYMEKTFVPEDNSYDYSFFQLID